MNAQGPPQEVLIAAMCIGGAIGLMIGLTIYTFFSLTLTRTLKEVDERNREIAPGTVWLTLVLMFIPVVSAIWVIYLVNKMAGSVRREYEARGWDASAEGFGRKPGLIWGWGSLLYLPISGIQIYLQLSGGMKAASLLSIVGMPVSIGLLVCLIMYWVQIYQYGTKLRERRRDGVEADYDDQPRRRQWDDEDEPRRRDRDED